MYSNLGLRPLFLLSLFTILTGVFPVWAQSDPQIISWEDYEAIRDISSAIVEKAPSEKFIYVGIGRSPTPIITFLSMMHPGSAGFLPLSHVGDMKEMMLEDKHSSSSYVREQHERMLKDLYRHFDRFLGPLIERSPGKKIVFIDYVRRGSGFQSALWFLRHYLSQKHPKLKFDFLALTESKNAAVHREWLPEKKVILLDPYESFKSRLLNSAYDSYAPFEMFDYERLLGGLEAEPGTQYEKLKTALEVLMEQNQPSRPASIKHSWAFSCFKLVRPQ